MAAAVVLVCVVGLGVGLAFAGTGGPKHHKDGGAHVTTTTTAHLASRLCPLTGQPARGGVPRRPAIGVKIGNDPASRPQSGLLAADIVYEEMAEGGITRYLAVFQCRQAAVLGPVRSVRWDDWHVLASYGHPILAFSGGIDQWNAMVASLHWLYDANASFYPMANAYHRTLNRVPPWNLYTSTAALWKLDPSDRTPPPPQFSYSAAPHGGTPVASVTIVNFASGENVVWKWDGPAHTWKRFYGSSPDVDASGVQLHATNVLIQIVHTRPGPYAESGTTPDTESITAGSGTAYLLRNGVLERGTWHTPKYGDPMKLLLTNGHTMTLAPGTTWVEMVPTEYAVQFSK